MSSDKCANWAARTDDLTAYRRAGGRVEVHSWTGRVVEVIGLAAGKFRGVVTDARRDGCRPSTSRVCGRSCPARGGGTSTLGTRRATRIARGVSGWSTLVTWPCTQRSREPEPHRPRPLAEPAARNFMPREPVIPARSSAAFDPLRRDDKTAIELFVAGVRGWGSWRWR
jgi:hypothetical protein